MGTLSTEAPNTGRVLRGLMSRGQLGLEKKIRQMKKEHPAPTEGVRAKEFRRKMKTVDVFLKPMAQTSRPLALGVDLPVSWLEKCRPATPMPGLILRLTWVAREKKKLPSTGNVKEDRLLAMTPKMPIRRGEEKAMKLPIRRGEEVAMKKTECPQSLRPSTAMKLKMPIRQGEENAKLA